MLTIIIRLCGLVAMFWTSWIVAIIALLPLLVVNGESFKGFALFKNDGARIVVEFLTSVVAIFGIWLFPLILPLHAHIVATVAGICSLYTFLAPIRGKLAGN